MPRLLPALLALLLCTSAAAADDEAHGLSGEIAARVGTALVALDVGSGSTRTLVAHTDYDRPLVWRPDGAELLFWCHDRGAWEIQAVPSAGGEPVVLAPVAWGGSRSAAWSPDGSRLALWRTDPEGLVVLAERGRGAPAPVASSVFRDVPPVWRPDGKALAFEAVTPRNESLEFSLRVATEAADGRWSLRDVGAGRAFAWIDEGRTLLVTGGRADDTYAFGRVELASGALRWVTPAGFEDREATWCTAHRRVVVLRHERGSDVHKVMSCAADGSDVREHGLAREPHGDLVVDARGRWIAWGEGADGARRLAVIAWAGGDVVRHDVAIGQELAAR
ncbi:MAG: hypothetical protein R3F05_09965 [Planctomycetota bacterium]